MVLDFFFGHHTLHIIIVCGMHCYHDGFGVIEEYERIGYFTDYIQPE